MAPTKFENDIKETLEKRAIKPSENSWEKLSQRLDDNQLKKSRRPYWMVGIAASILILISVGVAYFQNDNSEVLHDVLVDRPTEIDKTDSPQLETKDEIVAEKERTNDNIINSAVTESNSSLDKNQIIQNQKNKKSENYNNTILKEKPEVVVEEKPRVEVVEAFNHPNTELAIEIGKIEKVVNQIKNLEKDNGVSDREIDSLLKAAQRELFNDKLRSENTIKVSAESLLRDVEDDMDRSFRDKVYDALKNGYKSVKSAVAERKQN